MSGVGVANAVNAQGPQLTNTTCSRAAGSLTEITARLNPRG